MRERERERERENLSQSWAEETYKIHHEDHFQGGLPTRFVRLGVQFIQRLGCWYYTCAHASQGCTDGSHYTCDSALMKLLGYGW